MRFYKSSYARYVEYFCVPHNEDIEGDEQEAWIAANEYHSSMMYPNECRWIIPGTVSPLDD